MNMKSISFLILLILKLVLDSKCEYIVNIYCQIYVAKYKFIEKGNYCGAKFDLILEGNNVILNLSVMEENEAKESTIQGFRAVKKTIKYIPQFTSLISPDLKVLVIKESKLKYLTLKSFENLSNLELLNISGNEVEILPANVFKFNRKLKVIYLSKNKILEIHGSVFDSLESLIYLEFNCNVCYSGFANEISKIEELKMVLLTRCSSAYNDLELQENIKKLTTKIHSLENTTNKNLMILLIFLFSILIFQTISKICKLIKFTNPPSEPDVLYKTPFQHQSSYEFPSYSKQFSKRPANQLMSRNDSIKMNRQFMDDSNQNISVIDRKEVSVEIHHKNSNEIILNQLTADVYQVPADDQLYHEVVYSTSSVSQSREDTPRPEVIEEELYSEIIEVVEGRQDEGMMIYSLTKKTSSDE